MGHADRAQISQERIASIIATATAGRLGELIGEAARRGRPIVFEGAPAGLLANEPVRRGRLEV